MKYDKSYNNYVTRGPDAGDVSDSKRDRRETGRAGLSDDLCVCMFLNREEFAPMKIVLQPSRTRPPVYFISNVFQNIQ